MTFYQIYLTYLAAEREYILTLKKEVWTQIAELLVFGSDALWTSTKLFNNAINDMIIIFEYESEYQNVLFWWYDVICKLELGYLFFDIVSAIRNWWKCTSYTTFCSIMKYLNSYMSLYSNLDAGCLLSSNI